MAVVTKPHLVCVPFPLQSHIGAMMKLAKLLHHKGFHITFVNTEYNHNRMLEVQGPNSLDGLPGFMFETIPDGLPYSDPHTSQNIPSLIQSLLVDTEAPFLTLISKINERRETPAVTCILSDWLMTFTIDAAKEQLGLPVLLLWTISACCFMGFYQYHLLLGKELVPLKDEDLESKEHMNTILDWIPGKKEIRLDDLPTFILKTDNKEPNANYCMEAGKRASKATAHIVHTFVALESDLLDSLSSIFPSIYTIGPLQVLLNQIPHEKNQKKSKSIGCNLWKEESECLGWLDSKEPNSTIYVNFGSIAVITQERLEEIAWGLSNSNCNFLWVIRPDLVIGETTVLPPEFEIETKERGLIAGWCPQEQVLNHPSVGGFLTHCGWNSTLESLTAGVPMICLPYFADQEPNCRYICSVWGVGMEMDSEVKREKVEKLVGEILGGEEGKKLKKKAMDWKYLIEEATTSPDGSSCQGVDSLVKKILSFGS